MEGDPVAVVARKLPAVDPAVVDDERLELEDHAVALLDEDSGLGDHDGRTGVVEGHRVRGAYEGRDQHVPIQKLWWGQRGSRSRNERFSGKV